MEPSNAVGLLLCILFGGALTIILTIVDGVNDLIQFRWWWRCVTGIRPPCCVPGCENSAPYELKISETRTDWVCFSHL